MDNRIPQEDQEQAEYHRQRSNQSLLNKYDIPVTHLEYDYIGKCENAREMEKIVTVLRSGQEGVYPHLTQTAEERLAILKPKSKLLRRDLPLLTKSSMDKEECDELDKTIQDWTKDMQTREHDIQSSAGKNSVKVPRRGLPAVRNFTEVKGPEAGPKDSNSKRIASGDYDAWDKYDADAEVLKMDIKEELSRKEIEAATLKKEKDRARIDNLGEEIDSLTKGEREHLAQREKERGNESYRVGEYAEALRQYTNCITLVPSLAGYNNRSAANLKLKNFEAAACDSEHALTFDPANIKALTRKALALQGLGKHVLAMEYFEKAISLDPNNTTAQVGAAESRKYACSHKKEKSVRLKIDDNKNVHLKPSPKIMELPTEPELINDNSDKKTVTGLSGPSNAKPNTNASRTCLVPVPSTSRYRGASTRNIPVPSHMSPNDVDSTIVLTKSLSADEVIVLNSKNSSDTEKSSLIDNNKSKLLSKSNDKKNQKITVISSTEFSNGELSHGSCVKTMNDILDAGGSGEPCKKLTEPLSKGQGNFEDMNYDTYKVHASHSHAYHNEVQIGEVIHPKDGMSKDYTGDYNDSYLQNGDIIEDSDKAVLKEHVDHVIRSDLENIEDTDGVTLEEPIGHCNHDNSDLQNIEDTDGVTLEEPIGHCNHDNSDLQNIEDTDGVTLEEPIGHCNHDNSNLQNIEDTNGVTLEEPIGQCNHDNSNLQTGYIKETNDFKFKEPGGHYDNEHSDRQKEPNKEMKDDTELKGDCNDNHSELQTAKIKGNDEVTVKEYVGDEDQRTRKIDDYHQLHQEWKIEEPGAALKELVCDRNDDQSDLQKDIIVEDTNSAAFEEPVCICKDDQSDLQKGIIVEDTIRAAFEEPVCECKDDQSDLQKGIIVEDNNRAAFEEPVCECKDDQSDLQKGIIVEDNRAAFEEPVRHCTDDKIDLQNGDNNEEINEFAFEVAVRHSCNDQDELQIRDIEDTRVLYESHGNDNNRADTKNAELIMHQEPVNQCNLNNDEKLIKVSADCWAEISINNCTSKQNGNRSTLKPNTPYEFLKYWESIRDDVTLVARANLLRNIDPDDLKKVIGNKLDGPMLSTILCCLSQHFTPEDGETAEYLSRFLTALSQTSRFFIITMFMNREDVTNVKQIAEYIKKNGHNIPKEFSLYV